MKRPCPTCGKPQRRRAKVCDYCGTDLTGRLANPATPAGMSPSPPIPQPGPFSSPTGEVPMVGRATRTIIVFVVTAAIIAGAVFLFFFITKQVRKGLDSASGVGATISPFEIPSAITDPADGPQDGGREFKGADQMYKAMKAGGARCDNYDLAIESDIVSAATCFAGTEVWTLQVFLDDASWAPVVSGYKSNESVHIAYGGNWVVLTQTKASSKKIAKALDGRAT